VKCGIPQIDTELGGIPPLTGISNRTLSGDVSVGKTVFALVVARLNLPVLYYDLEQNINSFVFNSYSLPLDGVVVARIPDASIADELKEDIKLVIVDSITAVEKPGKFLRELIYTKLPCLLITQRRQMPGGPQYLPDESVIDPSLDAMFCLESIGMIRSGARRVGRKVKLVYNDWYGDTLYTAEMTAKFMFSKGFMPNGG
jgi:hypothetical protein